MKRNRDKEDEDGISFEYIYEQYRHSMFSMRMRFYMMHMLRRMSHQNVCLRSVKQSTVSDTFQSERFRIT